LGKEELNNVEFDFSGSYLAAVGQKTHMYDTKTWTKFATYGDHKDAVTDVKFGKNARSVLTTSMDRTMKIYTL
jgi:WD40 repeat protein